MADLEALAESLAGMIAGLQAHIDTRAEEIAQPQIRVVEEAATRVIADLRREAAVQKQRDDDLIRELRRQLDAAVKTRDREFDELKRLRGAVHRVRYQVRCWQNEDGKSFVFADDLRAALDGETETPK